ncbi:MAG: hypothetical protein JRE40_10300 [Deltaproteobacteria bacterium]|nr:hypothetical protein [Deltaproteobacteria bacterium]MBW2673930.1 hypothetical protein [Deltaproteobacteria bacterium]
MPWISAQDYFTALSEQEEDERDRWRSRIDRMIHEGVRFKEGKVCATPGCTNRIGKSRGKAIWCLDCRLEKETIANRKRGK